MRTGIATNWDLYTNTPGLQEKSGGYGIETTAIVGKIKPILGNEYPTAIISLIRLAKNSIYICAYTWKWYDYQAASAMQRINRAIIEKARNGIKIKARLNHEHQDHYLTKENTRTAQALRRYKIEVKFDGTQIMSHLKLIIIDENIAVLGSHNLTMRSVTMNNEASIAIFGKEAVKCYCDYFKRLWGN